MVKLVNATNLQQYSVKLWDKVQQRLTHYVHKTKENLISGKTVLANAYVLGAKLVFLDNPRATSLMRGDTYYFVCTGLTISAHQKVAQVTIGVDSGKQVGEVVTGVNIGAIRSSNHQVLDYIIRNGSAVVHRNADDQLQCEKAITLTINYTWSEEVCLIIGANGALWGDRDSGYGGLALGGSTLPNVGQTLTLNSTNYVGKVVVYGEEIPIRNFISPQNLTLTEPYQVGELKSLAYDAGERMEMNHQVWLKCEGQSVSKSDYPDLFHKLGESFEENRESFRLPTQLNTVGYLYICAKSNGHSMSGL